MTEMTKNIYRGFPYRECFFCKTPPCKVSSLVD